jgi:hypothetical protein
MVAAVRALSSVRAGAAGDEPALFSERVITVNIAHRFACVLLAANPQP